MEKTNSTEGYYHCRFAEKFEKEFKAFCKKENIENIYIDSVNNAGMTYVLFDVYIKTSREYNILKTEGLKLFSLDIVEV